MGPALLAGPILFATMTYMTRLTKTPQKYHHAERFHNECGPYQIRAILHSLEKDAEPHELYVSDKHRERDWTLPWHAARVFARYGLKARTHFWFRRLLKTHLLWALRRDRPVMFVIRSIHGNRGFHWISAWGYDDTTDEFLCYDSQAPASEGGHGNIRYTITTLKKTLPGFGTFAVVVKD